MFTATSFGTLCCLACLLTSAVIIVSSLTGAKLLLHGYGVTVVVRDTTKTLPCGIQKTDSYIAEQRPEKPSLNIVLYLWWFKNFFNLLA